MSRYITIARSGMYSDQQLISWVTFCSKQHDIECNQKYDNIHPYSFHLSLVEKQFDLFYHLLESGIERDWAFMGIWGHDLIEDARVSYNDIGKVANIHVAEICYLCTENKGRTRADRKGEDFYRELITNQVAVFVKLCDMIANVKYSLLTNSSMFNKYKSEYQTKIRETLYTEKYAPMFDHLDKIFSIK